MKKSALKRKITELSKHLTSKSAQNAINILKSEVENFIESTSSPQENQQELIVPKEVQNKEKAFALFTDGACRGNPGPGSYAYLIQNCEGDKVDEFAQVEELTTNNKMELKAIIYGLRSLEKKVSPMHEVFIYTDSKYAVDGMKSWIHGWKKRGWKKADNKSPENLDLWQELDELSKICHVSFNWVKGHAGHPQNEYVDQKANIVLDENGF